jgi:hypothetical protein
LQRRSCQDKLVALLQSCLKRICDNVRRFINVAQPSALCAACDEL